jgi:hypothetical protein
VMYGPEEAAAFAEAGLREYPLVRAAGGYRLYDVRGR